MKLHTEYFQVGQSIRNLHKQKNPKIVISIKKAMKPHCISSLTTHNASIGTHGGPIPPLKLPYSSYRSTTILSKKGSVHSACLIHINYQCLSKSSLVRTYSNPHLTCKGKSKTKHAPAHQKKKGG